MISVIPFFDPSTTPVWKLVNSSGHGIGVGDAPKARTSSCGRSATTVRIFSPSMSPGFWTRRLVLAKLRQPPVLPMVIKRILSPESANAMSRTLRVKSPASTCSAIRSSDIKYGKSNTCTYGKIPAAPPEVEI